MEPEAVLAVTMGEPSGIGPELIFRAWMMRHERPGASSFAAVADPDYLARAARDLRFDVAIQRCDAAEVAAIFKRALPVIDLGIAVDAKPGEPSVANAGAVISSITRTVDLVKQGACSAVVTSPIAKHVLQAHGFSYPGHTEFLGVLRGRALGQAGDAGHAAVVA